MGLPKPSRETKFSGADEDRKKIIFPVQLTTSRISNLTRLILTLATVYVMTLHTCIRHRVSPELIGSRIRVLMALTAESPLAQGQ